MQYISKPNFPSSNQGSALGYVLGIIAVLGLLLSIYWKSVKFNNNLAQQEQDIIQARLASESGLDYVLKKLSGSEAEHLEFQTDKLKYWLQDQKLSFTTSVQPYGLFTQATVTGELRKGDRVINKCERALIGQNLNLQDLPALALTNKEGQMVLAGKASVIGPILLWRGGVQKAIGAPLYWHGTIAHSGPVWDSNSTVWKKIEVSMAKAKTWVERQEIYWERLRFDNDADFDSFKITDRCTPSSLILIDSTWENIRWISADTVTIATGARIRNCKILANFIRIEGNASFKNSIVYALRNMNIIGAPQLQGQFIARDSLKINISSTQEHYPTFYVHGRVLAKSEKDSLYWGTMSIKQYQGQGVFLVNISEKPKYNQDIQIEVAAKTDIQGLIYTPGLVKMEGHLQGSLICQNLKFEEQGTIWFGHLKDAQLHAATTSQTIPVPLIFENLQPLPLQKNWLP